LGAAVIAVLIRSDLIPTMLIGALVSLFITLRCSWFFFSSIQFHSALLQHPQSSRIYLLGVPIEELLSPEPAGR